MPKVIDLEQRQSRARRIKRARDERRAQAVAAAMSCGLCPRRCAACGLAVDEPGIPLAQAPYPLCSACRGEIESFLRREQGETEKEAFWHTEDWEAMWRHWLAHMKAASAFRCSPVFLRLLDKRDD